MATEPETMREIHEIRERISEEIKHMTPEEHTAYVNDRAKEIAKKFGFELLDSAGTLQRA